MLLDGKALSNKIKEELQLTVASLKEKYNDVPTLSIIRVGDNSASEIYVKNKVKTASDVGMNAEVIHLDASISMEKLISTIDALNNNSKVNGIIVQLPLPQHLHEQTVIDRVRDEKDVDGFGLLNKGKLFSGISSLRPATPQGIMRLLDEYNIELSGKNSLVIGRSNIVGKPVALMLLERNSTVTIAHSKTKNLKEIALNADVVVVAVGKKHFLTADMVKEGAVVVDVGINRVDGKIYGDADFENIKNKASYITPVPGGVGPLTIVTLLNNTINAFVNQKEGQ